MQVEKTVFISYRRTNAMTARAVYQHLTAQGYDCFLDFESIDAGSFERIILNQIAAKAHFVVILTPSALERCAESGDWLRREIEYALDNGRNIVPLMFDGFSYRDVQKYLTGKLNMLSQYNSIEVPSAYFEEAMARLENRFLSKPLDIILHPTPIADRQAVAVAKLKVEQQPAVTEKQLSAEEWLERGFKRAEDDYDGKIADYTEAIRLNPKVVGIYILRGFAHNKKQDYDSAIADFNEAIRLDPNNAFAYFFRGEIHNLKQVYVNAIADFNEAIRLDPNNAVAYDSRGFARADKQDYVNAIADFNEAIRLDPNNAFAYHYRGLAYNLKQDYDNAIVDFNEAIRLDPNFAETYSYRGLAYHQKHDYDSAIADYNEAIRLNPGVANVYVFRGGIYHHRLAYDSAIADFEAALRIDPNVPLGKESLERVQRAKADQKKSSTPPT